MATDIADPATCEYIKNDWNQRYQHLQLQQNEQDRMAILRKTLMCADIGVVIEPYDIFMSWGGRLLYEMHAAYHPTTITSHNFKLDVNQCIQQQCHNETWLNGRYNNYFIQQHEKRLKENATIFIPPSIFSPVATTCTIANPTTSTTTSTTTATTTSTTTTPSPSPFPVPTGHGPSLSQFYQSQIAFLEKYAQALYQSVLDCDLIPSLSSYMINLKTNTYKLKENGTEAQQMFKQSFYEEVEKQGNHRNITLYEDQDITTSNHNNTNNHSSTNNNNQQPTTESITSTESAETSHKSNGRRKRKTKR